MHAILVPNECFDCRGQSDKQCLLVEMERLDEIVRHG